MLTGVVESDTGTRDEIFYGPGNDHLTRARRIQDARCEVNGDEQDGIACLGKTENSVDQTVGVLIAIVVELYYVSSSAPQPIPLFP